MLTVSGMATEVLEAFAALVAPMTATCFVSSTLYFMPVAPTITLFFAAPLTTTLNVFASVAPSLLLNVSVIFAVPAVKGIEFGAGFAAAALRGSENNDPFCIRDGIIATLTNNAGGILGGISDGMPIVFRAAVKPTPSVAKPQQSVNLNTMEPEELRTGGRHDPCIVPRAVPAIEATAALAVCDLLLGEGAWN